MKQEIITYISTLKHELHELSMFLYNNPEDNFHEYKACDYITRILKKNNFQVKRNYIDIPTAFYAQYGCGYPRICYICKYSAGSKNAHIYGNNINCAMIIGGALGLAKVIDKCNGSVIIVGCPGDNFNGSELIMTKENTFNDMDILITPHADIKNYESGTSMTVIPMCIKYTNTKYYNQHNIDYYSPIDACFFTFNTLSLFVKNICNKCSIDGISIESAKNPYILPSTCSSKFYIRTTTKEYANILDKKIRNFVKLISPLLNIEIEITLFELPSQNLLSNKILSRLFTHNLKESGIINIECCKDYNIGLSIGSVSHTTPCIYPSISIVENNNIIFPSKEFAKCTITEYAQDKLMKTAQALALTGLDIIEKENLLNEMTEELYTNK